MHRGRGQRLVGMMVLLASILGPAGCTKKRPALPPPVDITGQVVYENGKPVADMIVSFHADDDVTAQGKVPNAPLDKEGKFAISGVTPGKYKVTLAVIPSHAGQPANSNELIAPGKDDKKPALPRKYLNADTTPWKITVESPPKPEKLVVDMR